MYDRRCAKCEAVTLDCWEPIDTGSLPCSCGGETTRVWIGKGAAVIPDDIPGGLLVRHAICNEDGSPRRYYSKSEMKREAAARGWENNVVHKPDPGSDRSKHTSRWI